MVLGRKGANQSGPNPRQVRDRNSPVNPAVDVQLSHVVKLVRSAGQVNSLGPRQRTVRIETLMLLFSKLETWNFWRIQMAERPVATGTETRAGTKEGVVRYVLLASLVLVVVLFVVAYELFS